MLLVQLAKREILQEIKLQRKQFKNFFFLLISECQLYVGTKQYLCQATAMIGGAEIFVRLFGIFILVCDLRCL